MSLDRNANDPTRLRRNAQRERAGGATKDIGVTAPVTNSGAKLGIQIASAGGIQNSSGLALKLVSGTALAVSAAGLTLGVDGSTIEVNTGALRVKDGGITAAKIGSGAVSAVKLNVLTTKGDVMVYGSAHDRLPVGTDGQVLTADSTATQGLKWATAASGGGGGTAAGKNLLINGNFDIWQRAPAGDGNHSADRWRYSTGGNNSTLSRGTFTAGQTDVPDNPQYYWQYQFNSTFTGGNPTLEQRVDDVRTMQGAAVAFSFWVASNNARNIDVDLIQNFGSGGSTTVTTNVVSAQSIAGTGAWVNVTGTATLPSVSGKTIGADSYVSVRVKFPVAANIWKVAHFQLEAGAAYTAWDRRPIAAELAMCQRYYRQSYAMGTVAGTAGPLAGYVTFYTNTTSADIGPSVHYPAMRKAPTVTYYSPATTNDPGTIRNTTDSSNLDSAGPNVVTEYGFTGAKGALAASKLYSLHYIADAEL